tara:strand:+ start:118 stop:1020 length:903 start_codon:yes stop_codon:yes gene_type:complete
MSSRLLYVTCFGENGGLYLVNPEKDRWILLDRGQFRSIALEGNYLYAAAELPDGMGSRIVVYEVRYFSRVREIMSSATCPHDLFVDGSNLVLVSSDGDLGESVFFIDKKNFETVRIFGFGLNKTHLNSIINLNGQWIATVHRLSVEEDKQANTGRLLNITQCIENNNYTDYEILLDKLWQPHDVTYHDGKIWLTDSVNSSIVSFDLSTGQRNTITVGEHSRFETDGSIEKEYARGLLFYDGMTYCGFSCGRHSKFPGNCFIREFDSKTNLLASITDSPAAEIYAIRPAENIASFLKRSVL